MCKSFITLLTRVDGAKEYSTRTAARVGYVYKDAREEDSVPITWFM